MLLFRYLRRQSNGAPRARGRVKGAAIKRKTLFFRRLDDRQPPRMGDAPGPPFPDRLGASAKLGTDALYERPLVYHRSRLSDKSSGSSRGEIASRVLTILNGQNVRVRGESQYRRAFYARIKACRLAADLSQADVAYVLGIKEDTYGKYERSTMMPHSLIPRFAVVARCDLSYLLTGQGTGPPVPAGSDPPPKRRRTTKAPRTRSSG